MTSSRTTFTSEFGKANWYKLLAMAEFGKAHEVGSLLPGKMVWKSHLNGLEKPKTMHPSSSLVWKSHCLKWPNGPELGLDSVLKQHFFWANTIWQKAFKHFSNDIFPVPKDVCF